MAATSAASPLLLDAPVPQAEVNELLHLVAAFATTRCVQLVAEFGIADALGDASATAGEIAARTGVDANALGRIMRYTATLGVFEHLGADRFAHTNRSRLLRTDHPQSLRGWTRISGPGWPVYGALDHSLRTGRPAIEALARGGVWEWLNANPQQAQAFDEAMTSRNRAELPALLEAYDFSRFRSFADIGGGQGHLLRGVLDHVPGATGTLFDRCAVVDPLRQRTAERISIVGGDFFKDPLPCAEVYLLRQVIHDWDDAHAICILRNLRRVAPPAGRVLLIEVLLPPIAQTMQSSHPFFMDVAMLVWTSGRERMRDEYAKLLDAGGWRLERVVPTACHMSIIEAVPVSA